MVNILDTTDADGKPVQFNQVELSTEAGRDQLAERLRIIREELDARYKRTLGTSVTFANNGAVQTREFPTNT